MGAPYRGLVGLWVNQVLDCNSKIKPLVTICNLFRFILSTRVTFLPITNFISFSIIFNKKKQKQNTDGKYPYIMARKNYLQGPYKKKALTPYATLHKMRCSFLIYFVFGSKSKENVKQAHFSTEETLFCKLP